MYSNKHRHGCILCNILKMRHRLRSHTIFCFIFDKKFDLTKNFDILQNISIFNQKFRSLTKNFDFWSNLNFIWIFVRDGTCRSRFVQKLVKILNLAKNCNKHKIYNFHFFLYFSSKSFKTQLLNWRKEMRRLKFSHRWINLINYQFWTKLLNFVQIIGFGPKFCFLTEFLIF